MSNRSVQVEARKPHAWLSRTAKDESIPEYASQRGEDRILYTVFELIGAKSRWCVEFGAADGKRGSNTWQFINKQNWSGVQIEPKHDRDLMVKQKRDTYEALTKRYADSDRVQCLDVVVGYGEEDNLDVVLSRTATPLQFDLLSIDIDGEDYRVWQAVKKYRPRVVIIEHNKTIPIDVDFASSSGSSLRALARLGKEKGYELVAATMVNAVFVTAEEFNVFAIANNDPRELWEDREQFQQHIWQQYDGTMIIQGRDKVRWVRSVDGTVSGQLAAGRFQHIGNRTELWASDRELGGVERPMVSGRLRQLAYKILDRI